MNKLILSVLLGAAMFTTAEQLVIAAPVDESAASASTAPLQAPAFPHAPFVINKNLDPNVSVAIGTGTNASIGITSIIFSNNSASQVQVDFFEASTSAPQCGGTVSGTIGDHPDSFIVVKPQSTAQYTFPSPLVVKPISGQSCLGFGSTGGALDNGVISVIVSGFLNK
jgi:hypothetical protein